MDAYERYGRALLRKAERIVGNREDARDILQALFVDLLERGADADANDLAYLYRAVTNRCLNVIRDRNNRARLLARQDAVLRGPTLAQTRCSRYVPNASSTSASAASVA